MIDAPVAVAFGAGMIATVNPCGFAMLPAYLTYFLGADTNDNRPALGPIRALGVGASVSAGFITLFAFAGMAFSWLSVEVYEIAPWITVVIAVGLVALGSAMLAGWEPIVSLPKLEKGGKDRTFLSMYIFGVSYAIASLGCTLPVFVGTISGTVTSHNALSGLMVYLAYGLGMGVVLTTLTLAIAGARGTMVARMKGLIPYVNRIGGAFVVIAGLYIGWYGIFELRSLRGNSPVGADRSISTVTGWSGTISNWVDDFGPVRLGLVLMLVIAVTVLVTLLRTGDARRDTDANNAQGSQQNQS